MNYRDIIVFDFETGGESAQMPTNTDCCGSYSRKTHLQPEVHLTAKLGLFR